jgi:hypothetical protein
VAAEFRMGSTDVEHLSIMVLGREHADADDYWDGNWVVAMISLAVGGFTGSGRASLRTDEIHRFNEGLKFVNQNLFGAAVLESMEHWISLTVKAGARGRIEISGELRDGAGSAMSCPLIWPRWTRHTWPAGSATWTTSGKPFLSSGDLESLTDHRQDRPRAVALSTANEVVGG